MGDDEPPQHSSCSGATASTSGDGSSSSPSNRSLPPPPPPAPPLSSLPLAAVVTPLPPPFPSAGPIATAIPLPQQQQLLQQYQLQQLQQQRLFSFHLASAAGASPSPATPASIPLKHPLPFSSPSPAPAFAPGGPAPSDRPSRDDCWSEGATFTLIQAWGDRYLELNRGNLKQKHWRDVADAVNRRADGSKTPKTDIQCKNRIDTLKKKYKLEKSKIGVGGPTKWTFFDRLDELIGNSKKPKKPLAVKPRSSVPPLPLPAAAALPAKRPLEDGDQGQQFQTPFLAGMNHCLSSAANHHLTPNHSGRAPNHCPSGSNYAGSSPDHAAIVPCHTANNPNFGFGPPNHFRSRAYDVAGAADATSKSKESTHSAESCPNGESAQPKRPKRKRPCTDPIQDLAQAIAKFGEVYERTEIARQQMLTEIEKQRMIFAKDLELQRLQFFTKTQVELAKLRLKFKRGQTDHNS